MKYNHVCLGGKARKYCLQRRHILDIFKSLGFWVLVCYIIRLIVFFYFCYFLLQFVTAQFWKGTLCTKCRETASLGKTESLKVVKRCKSLKLILKWARLFYGRGKKLFEHLDTTNFLWLRHEFPGKFLTSSFEYFGDSLRLLFKCTWKLKEKYWLVSIISWDEIWQQVNVCTDFFISMMVCYRAKKKSCKHLAIARFILMN